MKKLKVAYFGNPGYSAKLLEYLLRLQEASNYEIVLGVTNPPAIVGKNKELTPSPVEVVLARHGAPIFNKNLRNNSPELLDLYKKLEIDIGILFSYGQIIPSNIIDALRGGILNIHPSSLPLFRGASPIAYPVMLGISESAISVMKMDSKLDHGPIIEQVSFSLTKKTAFELNDEVPDLIGGKLLLLLDEFANKMRLGAIEQIHSQATFTRQFVRSDGFVESEFIFDAIHDSNQSSFLPIPLVEYQKKYDISETRSRGKILFDFWRAMHPWPGVFTQYMTKGGKRRIKLIKLDFEKELKIETIQIEGEKEKINNIFI